MAPFAPAFVILVVTLCSQLGKPTLTLEQCRADQQLWLSRLESPPGVDSIAYMELGKWWHEMHECDVSDPDNHDHYYNTINEIQAVEQLRLVDYLDRHELLLQFFEEDAAGKR